MSKYQYVINPRIPIRGLVEKEVIKRETCLMLDLDEVKNCLRHGPVYRKPKGSTQLLRVTLYNCLELHKAIDPEVEESVTEEKVEEPVKEPVIDEPIIAVDIKPEEPEAVLEEKVEEPTEEVESKEEPTDEGFEAFGPEDESTKEDTNDNNESSNSNNNNYRHNKKRRNR